VASVVAAASAWIVLGVVRNALPKYLEAKGKNLATKEDISEITRLQEEARVDFVEQLHRRGVFERGGVRDIDNGRGAFERIGQPIARDDVDSRAT
jgi:hypothetical protein